MPAPESKKFKRTKENFVCEHCKHPTAGNGYTNHCPKCLWSRHVDINPGDRAAQCGGMMKPTGVLLKQGDHIVIHECVKCGQERKNKTTPQDNFDIIIELSAPSNPS